MSNYTPIYIGPGRTVTLIANGKDVYIHAEAGSTLIMQGPVGHFWSTGTISMQGNLIAGGGITGGQPPGFNQAVKPFRQPSNGETVTL